MYWIKGVELNDNDITEYGHGKWDIDQKWDYEYIEYLIR